jgi:YggT family protein
MTEYTQNRMGVKERIVRGAGPVRDVPPGPTIVRREQTVVVQDVDSLQREQVVQDLGLEREAILAKLTGLMLLLVGLLEGIISLRVVLKLIAANPANPFASLVYGLTDLFLWPFHNLVANPTAANGTTLEVTSLIAMVIYGLLAWVTAYLLRIVFSPAAAQIISLYRSDEL